MKPTELLEILRRWNDLEQDDREYLLSGTEAVLCGSDAAVRLKTSGFLEEKKDGSLGRRHENVLRDFAFLRSLSAAGMGREGGVRYAESVFSETRRDELIGFSSPAWRSGDIFLKEVCTKRHYQRFFREPGSFLKKRTDPSGFDPPPEAFERGKQVLSYILTSSGPVAVEEIARAFPSEKGEALSEAFAACLRLGLLVLFCGKDDLKIYAGLWPNLVLGRTVESEKTALAPLEVETHMLSPYIVSDLETLLVQASRRKLRKRVRGNALHRREAGRLESSFRALFSGENEAVSFIDPPGNRLERSLFLSDELGLLSADGEGRENILAATRGGLFWLSRPFKKKALHIAHRLRKNLKAGASERSLFAYFSVLLGGGRAYDLLDLTDYTVERWDTPAEDDGLRPRDPFELRRDLVEKCLFSYLLPLGGLMLAESGGRIAAALSSFGKFLLGEGSPPSFKEEDLPRLDVFPDLRLRMERPDRRAEEKIAVFSEALPLQGWYRITRRSLGRAAASGIPKEVILRVLLDLSRGVLTQAAKEELDRLYDSFFEVSLLEGYLVECRDLASARRFSRLSVFPAPKRISDRIFLIDPSVDPGALAEACGPEGIVLKVPRSPGSRNSPGSSRPA